MKKILALVLILALAGSMIAACGGNTDETEPADISNETESFIDDGNNDGPVISNGDAETTDGMVNPVVSVTLDEQGEMTGIRLEAPEQAEDVAYYVIEDKSEEPMAQTVFSIDGIEYCYRAERTAQIDAFDNSGMCYEWEDEGSIDIDYCHGYYGTCAGVAVCYWLDVVPGVNYSLSGIGEVTARDVITMAIQLYVPLQEEVV